MKSGGSLAVVVLDWNGGDKTLACLEAVYASKGVTPRVILVDNGSRVPVTREARRRFPQLDVRETGRNLGYAAGNNVGIEAALAGGADGVVLLNNDVEVRPDALREMAAAACGERVAAVGARVLRYDDPSRLWMAWGELTYRQSLVRLVGEGEEDGPSFAITREAAWVSGCAFLMTREAIERIGPLDEAYFAYHEEVDWCTRAREMGWRVVYAGRAVVVHRGASSSGGGQYVSRKQYLVARNMIRFVRRHGSTWEKLRFGLWLGATLPLQYFRRLFSGEQAGVVLKGRGILDALLGRPIPREELGLD